MTVAMAALEKSYDRYIRPLKLVNVPQGILARFLGSSVNETLHSFLRGQIGTVVRYAAEKLANPATVPA